MIDVGKRIMSNHYASFQVMRCDMSYDNKLAVNTIRYDTTQYDTIRYDTIECMSRSDTVYIELVAART